MCVVFGVTTISIGKMTDMILGRPNGTQRDGASLPCPPACWSARLASSLAWYSGVSGACWPRPSGFDWSHCTPIPEGLRHWPEKSGYFDSSNAWALIGSASIAASGIAPMKFRFDMMAFSLGFPVLTIARIALACHPAAHDRPARRDRHFRGLLEISQVRRR